MMKNCFLFIVCILFFDSCRKVKEDNSSSIDNTLKIENTGDFNFESYPIDIPKPIHVYYHIPNNIDKTNAPILFVFPGMNRNADEYRNVWIEFANQFHFMVFSLEFSNEYFPNSNAYQEGYVYNEIGELNQENKWTFSYIEPLFDKIKNSLNYQNNEYDIFGHSAGAQFVHRYVVFKPLSRLNRAIAANSGWYTIPDTSIAFPYGLKNTSISNYNLENIFTNILYIHIGSNDNNSNDPSLRKTPEANAQGSNRYERANYFYSKSDSISSSNNFLFNWELQEVNDVGHNHQQMANYAAAFLYQ